MKASPPAELPPAMLEALAAGQELDAADLAWAIQRWGFDLRARQDPLVRELEVELRGLGIDGEQLKVVSERSTISPPPPSTPIPVADALVPSRDALRIGHDPDSIVDRAEHVGRTAEDVEAALFLGRVERESDRICGRGRRAFQVISGRRPGR